MYVRQGENGVVFVGQDGRHSLAVTGIHDDSRNGMWLYVAGERQMIEVRVTPTGFIRVGKIKKTHEFARPSAQTKGTP